MRNLDSILKNRDIILPTKVSIVKAMVYPLAMYRCESWTIKNADHQRIDAFELWCWRRLWKSPLDCKEIKPVHPKGNQPWIFIERTDAKAEAPIFWPPDSKSQLTGKDPDAGKEWRQKEKRAAEDEMARKHYWLNGHEFEQSLGESGGQRNLMWQSSWGCREFFLSSWWSKISFSIVSFLFGEIPFAIL